MPVKLKICGMKYPDNIKEVANLQPDYMGFIFWEPSPRFFEAEMPEIDKKIKKTGVFVNATTAFIKEKINRYQLRAVQLHGTEKPEDLAELTTAGVEIIKAFSIDQNFDFASLKPYDAVCDFYLFDTKGKLPGGNGYTFDWTILKNYRGSKPFFLSGGIGLDEAGEIKDVTDLDLPLYAIDVNSKFEDRPGLKNTEKLTIFNKRIHQT